MGLPVYASTERAAVVRFLRAEAAKFEREANAHDEECAKEMVASAVSPRLRDQASVLRTVASYIERGDHLASEAMAPLTSEVVLRAMLRAYEAAAFEALVKHYQAEDGQGEAELDASEAINGLVNELRSEAAHASAGYPAHDLTTPRLIADYEARLAGTRPLVAPPLEVP